MLSLSPSIDLLSQVLHRWCRQQRIRHRGHGLRQWQVVCNHGGTLSYPLLLLLLEVGGYMLLHNLFNNSSTTAMPNWYDRRSFCNALISSCVRYGKSPQSTLILYDKMQKLDLVHHLKEHSFVVLVKTCAAVGDIERGIQIHLTVSGMGLLVRSLFLGTSLVDMYAKCGSLGKALELFDALLTRDVVSWNTLLRAHTDMGYSKHVLKLFHHMQIEGISPDALTFACTLKACAALQDIDQGKCMHAHIKTQNACLERDLIVATTLVGMYAKCGLLTKARAVLDNIPVRDLALWNVIITAYAEHGHGIEAIKCFERMQVEGVPPNNSTFICTLKACGIVGAKEKCMEIHNGVEKSGLLEREITVANCVINTYCKCGCILKAQEVFDKLPIRDVVTWTTLIIGYAEQMDGNEALRCFEQMQHEGVFADALTFASCLKACGSVGATSKGIEIHVKLETNGLLGRDYVLSTSLVDMYSKCGLLAKAQEAFDNLQVKDVVAWNSLIAGYSECGYAEEALKCSEQMQSVGIMPTDVTILCSLKSCSSIGALDRGHNIHADIEKKGLLEKDIMVGSTVVDMYAKCGSLRAAHKVFNQLPVRDVVLWNLLISGYAEHGKCEHVFCVFDRMVVEGIKPDSVTFLVILNACNRTGIMSKSEMLFEVMSRDFGICPAVEHHTGMVGLLCRIGCMDVAFSAVEKMPCHNLVLWRSVLGACRNFGNVRFGKQAFQFAMQLDEKDAASYALITQVCAYDDQPCLAVG